MEHNFDLLMKHAAVRKFKEDCTVGNWCFSANGAGSFTISCSGVDIIACESNQITDVQWGRRVEGYSPSEFLSILLKRVPQVYLDPMIIRTDDCFSALGFTEHSKQISTVPGLEDVDYYRAWVTSKPNERAPEKVDYIVYWDLGNTWCDVLAVFEGVTHEEFVANLRVKYNEWIQEEPSFDALEKDMPRIPPANLTEQIQNATARTFGIPSSPMRRAETPNRNIDL